MRKVLQRTGLVVGVRFIRLVAPNISAMLPEYSDAQLITAPPLNAPGLGAAKGYSEGQFTRLLRQGVGLGDRELRDICTFLQAREPG